MKRLALFAVGALALPLVSQSAILQIDMSGWAGSYVGNNVPVSGGTSWNVVPNANDQLSLAAVWDDGSALGSIAFDQGRTTGGDADTVIDWNSQPAGDYQNGSGTGGIWDETIMRDWVYTSGNDTYAARISGLSAGTYGVYALVGEPSSPTRTYTISIGVGTSTSPIVDETDARLVSALLDDDSNDDSVHDSSSWIVGKTYVYQEVTITDASDYLTILTDSNDAYSSLSGLQISQIPEPATLGLIAVFGGCILFVRRLFML